MENKLFLKRYRLSLGWNGLPVELHRTPTAIMYRGQELESGREVAVELVPWRSTDAAAREQLEEQATAAKQINHINIPKLYDFGLEDGHLIYVTEYFDGHTAEAWVAARGPLPTAAVLRAAVQVADALRAASFHRISHRALCPANIVFLPNETALGDWPSVKVLHWLGVPTNFAHAEEDARLAAAARFASPEQLRGEKVDFPSATYSLGCSMWFLLTGVRPAGAGSGAKGPAVPNDVEKLRGVPKIVRHLLGRMLRINPAERPQDPVALSAFLQTCLARVERRGAMNRRLRLPAGARPRVVEEGAPRKRPTKALAVAAILLGCAAALAAIAMPRYFHGRNTVLASTPAKEANRPISKPVNPSAPIVTSAPAQPGKAAAPALASNSIRADLSRDQITANPKSFSAAQSEDVPATNTIVSTSAPEQTLAAKTQADSGEQDKTGDRVATEAASPEEGPRVVAAPSALPHETLPADEAPAEVTQTNPPTENKTRDHVLTEAAPPEEGPKLVAASPSTLSREASTEEEAPAELTQTNPPNESMAEPTEVPSNSLAAAPPQAPNVAVNPLPTGTDDSASQSAWEPRAEDPNPIAKVSSQKKSTARSIAAKSASRKKRSDKSAKVAHTTQQKTSRIATAARRAQKLPTLRVGADRAELVGTTSDGKWILSVASSDRRLIVPPPPGFSQ